MAKYFKEQGIEPGSWKKAPAAGSSLPTPAEAEQSNGEQPQQQQQQQSQRPKA